MNKKTLLSFYLLLLALPLWSRENIDNPVLPGVADAGVMKYNGRYYIGGVFTRGDFYVSSDLVHWEGPVHAVSMNNEWATQFGIGDEQIHANDVRYINGVFHLYWSVNHWGRERNVVHIAHAEALSPLGPYREPDRDRWLDNRIDPHLFIDDNGQMYLYMVKFTDGNTIWARPMKDPATFAGEPKYIFASQPGSWETLDNRVAEGAWVIKYRNRYYLMYNANHTSTQWGNYMLGVAEASGPLDFNHGNKYPHPVVKSNQIELEETYVDLLKYRDNGMFYYSLMPVADEWYKPGQDVSGWKEGKPGFGFPVTENSTTQKVKTIWKSGTCFLYKPFVYDKSKNGNLSLRIHHTGAAKVYLNGTLIYSREQGDYRHVGLSDSKHLLTNGSNVLAVEGQPGRRSNFLDVALFDMKDQEAGDILFTPGQPNILRGPNGFEWWLVYMANKNAEPRGQYINRIHFFGQKLTVDGITDKSSPGYHSAPAKPTYRYLSGNGQALPEVNQTIPSIPATHYYFEVGVKSAATGAASDGIIAWKADEQNWLKIVADASGKKWLYVLHQNGKESTQAFPLAEDFKANVFHTIAVFKNHTNFTVRIDDLPAPGNPVVETNFAGQGLPGICSGNANAEFDGITYTIGWDEYGQEINGWQASDNAADLLLKGDLLDSYEMSVQIDSRQGKGIASVYPVYADPKNYVKATFDFSGQQFYLSGKFKGKDTPVQKFSLSRIKDYYANNVFSDFMERHFTFEAPTTLNAILLPKEAVYRSDTVIENIHEKFHIYYVKDGRWQELENIRHTAWEHPGFSRIEFSPVEVTELVFVHKTGERENFVMRDLALQKIKVNEMFKSSYNFRVVKSKKNIRFFVDEKAIVEIPNNYENSKAGLSSEKDEVDFKAVNLFHFIE
jgi:GH43 family beta-xylosidase